MLKVSCRITAFFNPITASSKDITKKYINLKLASSSNGNVFTWVSGKRPVPLSVLPVPSTFLRPQASSSWCFNPGSVRTSSGSKSPVIGKETWNY